jgi:predicted glycogen debranching enzyme
MGLPFRPTNPSQTDFAMKQQPMPGSHQLLFRGDAVTFELVLPQAEAGEAFLRTNLGHAALQREDIIAWTERNQPARGLEWHDLPMARVDERTFRLTVALLEVGHFEGKCLFFPEGKDEPGWPDGPNANINVEPGEYLCANSIYCAFVRQFDGSKNLARTSKTDQYLSGIQRLDQRGYTVIPPSGTFRNLIRELDFIIHELNCRILHLLPIHPTPTVFGRMGRFGSPYAALDFTGVDPALAEFDRKATPLDQFRELADAVHQRNAKLFIDLAINHTGWASKLHETHPEWFVREADGAFHCPGAWGVTWGDLTELDHSRRDLWKWLADVFLTWCERGVDGFRCDAGYMIPADAWRYITARVRREYPDTVFLLEGLGGDPAVTELLLDRANLNWAYSELFQNFTRDQITAYLPYAEQVSRTKGIMVHYAETHDNNRLAATSPTYARLRTSLAALASRNGAFGFTGGVEWFATEKIDVHEANALNWGAAENQVAHIARLNRILNSHPAFYDQTTLRFVATAGTDRKYDPDTLGFIRTDKTGKAALFVLANLNCEELNRVFWLPGELPFGESPLFDLITGETVALEQEDNRVSLLMAPGEIRCLTPDAAALERIRDYESRHILRPDRIDRQRARAVALELICRRRKQMAIPEVDADRLAEALLTDPEDFCQRFCNEDGELSVVVWRSPADLRRRVMVPPDHALLLLVPSRFRARILAAGNVLIQRDSLKAADGRHFMLFAPRRAPRQHTLHQLRIDLFGESGLRRETAELLLLSKGDDPVSLALDNDGVRAPGSVFLAGNGRGAMCHLPLPWGEVYSKYDALLAANLHPDHPEDRHVFWTRCRVWLRHQAHSQPCWIHTVVGFRLEHDGAGTWEFHLPAGGGRYVDLTFRLAMVPGRNAVTLDVTRLQRDDEDLYLADDTPVQVIFRPDIEDRNFHQTTKAAAGPETQWPGAVAAIDGGFAFAPSPGRSLHLTASAGEFRASAEWQYDVFHPVEAGRGLEAHGDLFSPGYFDVRLRGGDTVQLLGQALTPAEPKPLTATAAIPPAAPPGIPDFEGLLQRAMDVFVVRRGTLKTVVAGYPWFLDWGRDTLICARGLIAAGRTGEVADILLAFAQFAEKGTLPNILSGGTAANRDTSDAPLWLILACRDFHRAHPEFNLLEREVPGRGIDLRGVLTGIVESYLAGTANGIRVDAESGLVFSPSHFTWMDTNHPAGTPRQGYPVEIQALWFAALRFLAEIGAGRDWVELADMVRHSVASLFLREDGWLSDCIHARHGVGAAAGTPDDHLRPNQLLAITLGLVEDRSLRESILASTAELLIPGAICSLADRPVTHHLAIRGGAEGRLLNDPQRPYWGHYEGDEDTRRKPAYHNGTAWTWLFPSYPEAYLMTFGEPGRRTAKAILSSAKLLLADGCVGQLPEILDGDIPHTQRGCDAQAWGVTELYRVWKLAVRDRR